MTVLPAVLLVVTARFTIIFLEIERKNEAWKEERRKGGREENE